MRWLHITLVLAGCGSSEPPRVAQTREQLGAILFADPRLSEPKGQACADCHVATAAFADPEDDRTSAGVVRERFGVRNTPSAMYLRFTPPLHEEGGKMVGGLFWDGRASTFADQAAFPLLNPLEMNNPDRGAVATKLRKFYPRDFKALYGANIFTDADKVFAAAGDALGAFERTDVFAPFSSRYDRYLAGTETLTASERRGLAIFEDPARGNCAGCHPSRRGIDGSPPMFTNFAYANLGIPKYVNSMFYRQVTDLNPVGEAYTDLGLGTTVKDATQDGKFRTPTLRNIAQTGPYGHNGYFQNLAYILDFLNTRDTRSPDPKTKPWAPPEIARNVDAGVGRLGLGKADMIDLEAFLDTLDDGVPGM